MDLTIQEQIDLIIAHYEEIIEEGETVLKKIVQDGRTRCAFFAVSTKGRVLCDDSTILNSCLMDEGEYEVYAGCYDITDDFYDVESDVFGYAEKHYPELIKEFTKANQQLKDEDEDQFMDELYEFLQDNDVVSKSETAYILSKIEAEASDMVSFAIDEAINNLERQLEYA